MLFKKPALACTSAPHFSSLTHCSTSSTPCPSFYTPSRSRVHRQPHRTYATINDNTTSNSGPSSSDLPWPPLGNPPRPPSPYQIFNQSPSEPYSKRRFYELVKLYHPDRHKHSTDSAPPIELLERYRLVIAANAILSDPNKKAAYDRFGQGWASEFESDSPNAAAYGGGYKYGTRHRWRTDASAAYQWPVDQDPMYNATWEDWERWYGAQIKMARERARAEKRGAGSARTSSSSPWAAFFTERDENEKQGPVYASNYAFISIVFLLAALGGAGQATRANEQAKTRLERTQEVNHQTSKVLMEARQSTRDHVDAGGTKGKRIQRFLREQGDYEEGEFDARALRPGDDGLCAPGLTKDRDERRFWQKPPEDR